MSETQQLEPCPDDVLSDAATLRGFINTHHMTPSMVLSLMYHWQRRALAAENEIATLARSGHLLSTASPDIAPSKERAV